ncbi:MAG: hypothetical protein ACW98Y_03100 [Candidatus Thorarchaeota archaeon]
MYKTVVGQILEIYEEEWSRVITLETPLGDIVYLKYQPDATGTTPNVGGVYTITYLVEGDTLKVTDVKKPAPGEYRAEFERSTESKRAAEAQSGASYERRYTTSITPSTSRETGTRPGRSEYAPTTSVVDGVRPNGIALIATMLLVVGAPTLALAVLFGAFPYAGLFGFVFGFVGIVTLLLAWGIYTYREWARTGMLILGVIMCITIIGIFVGGPIIWYLEQKHIKRMFIF